MRADVVKLEDTQASGACARNGLWVQIPPSAPIKLIFNSQFSISNKLSILQFSIEN